MSTVTRLPGVPELTPMEAALNDLQRQRLAVAKRAQQLGLDDPAVPKVATDAKADFPWPPDYVDALTRPVRVEISFDDPVKTREQLEVLMGAAVEAQAISQQHEIGFVRQRMRMRETIKVAADVLTMMNGKTPTGRKRK